MLKVRQLEVSYGAIKAIKGIDITVREGEIVAFIGANGAGKTTILRTISGLKKADCGVVELDDVDLTHVQPHKIVSLGMAHIPEGRQIFPSLSVEENLKLGGYILNDKDKAKQNIEKMYEKFPRLKERRKQPAGTLSGGEQQMLAMARALMTDPKIILMDEPSMGLSPILVQEIFEIIKEINQNGVTVLLVEQNAKAALSIANYGYVIETGKIVVEGEASSLLNNDDIKKAYLGA